MPQYANLCGSMKKSESVSDGEGNTSLTRQCACLYIENQISIRAPYMFWAINTHQRRGASQPERERMRLLAFYANAVWCAPAARPVELGERKRTNVCVLPGTAAADMASGWRTWLANVEHKQSCVAKSVAT